MFLERKEHGRVFREGLLREAGPGGQGFASCWFSLGMMAAHIFDPSTSEAGGSLEFKSSLVYTVSPRPIRIT
jgi:hypothetical protein